MKRYWQALAMLALAAVASAAAAQAYPVRPVRIIVPLSTGSALDTLARLAAQKLSESWGQSVTVENLPGANGITGTESVVKAPADGYTLVMLAANHVINASLYRKLPFDTLRDIKPVVRIAFTPLVLCVNPNLQAKSVGELIALAKARPGQLNYGSSGNGSSLHLAAEMFKTATGAELTHVPYKAVSQAQTDLLGGQIDLMFVGVAVALPQIQAGKLRGLGVTSLKRIPQLPEVPAINEAGVPGFEVISWLGLAAPAGTPDEVANRIYVEVAKIVAQPDVRARLTSLAMEPALLAPKEFAAFMADDQAKWGAVVKKSGAQLDY